MFAYVQRVLTSAEVLFFSQKTPPLLLAKLTQSYLSPYGHYSKYGLIYHRQRIPWLTPDVSLAH